MFITSTEWKTEWGGAKSRDFKTPFKRLPYYCCALTFTPFEDPVCTKEGHVFDILNIVPYVTKFKKNPVTGKPMAVKDLIKIQFHKNADGEYQCPVLHKVFTEFTHIVAVKKTGNVFSYEAIRELNIKPKNWKELLTDEPFTRDDIITIQDPNNLDAKVLSDFDHVKKEVDLDSDELKALKDDPAYGINMTGDTKRILNELGTEKGREIATAGGGGDRTQREHAAAVAALKRAKKRAQDHPEEEKKEAPKPVALSVVDIASAAINGRSASAALAGSAEKTAAHVAAHTAGSLAPVNSRLVKSKYTSGAASRSFTSTSYDPVTQNEFEYVQAERNPKKKGYVRMHTSHGDLNIELHCDITPRTCENFLTLCERGYYDNVVFHRSIKNFMIQGGDPTGTGRGGESIWGKPFKDELNSKVVHSERGVLSMANSGPHSNGSQFFFLYKSANHLNYKHTVFGRIVGGLEVLSAMEKVPVDDDDRPLEEIKILRVSVFVNPYAEMEEEERKAAAEAAAKPADAEEEAEKLGTWYSNPSAGLAPQAYGTGVGKYLKSVVPGVVRKEIDVAEAEEDVPIKRKKVENTNGIQFKDFSSW